MVKTAIRSPDDLLGVSQAAQQYNYNSRTVRQMIADGKLKAERIGVHGKWMVLRADMDALKTPSPTLKPKDVEAPTPPVVTEAPPQWVDPITRLGNFILRRQ